MSIYSFDKPEQIPEKDMVVPVGASGEAIKAVDTMAVQEGKKTDKVKVVETAGPLSHVYTQALNIALANESVVLNTAIRPSASAINQTQAPESHTSDENSTAEYVYVLGDRIESDHEAMEAFNALNKAQASGKYAKLHLAIEGALSNKICKRLSVVIESAILMGVNVVAKGQFGAEAAALSLAEHLRK